MRTRLGVLALLNQIGEGLVHERLKLAAFLLRERMHYRENFGVESPAACIRAKGAMPPNPLKLEEETVWNTLGTLLDRVEQGEEIVITRHGKPVARLVPNSGRIDRAQAQAAAERIRARAMHLKAGFDWNALKADRDAGRP